MSMVVFKKFEVLQQNFWAYAFTKCLQKAFSDQSFIPVWLWWRHKKETVTKLLSEKVFCRHIVNAFAQNFCWRTSKFSSTSMVGYCNKEKAWKKVMEDLIWLGNDRINLKWNRRKGSLIVWIHLSNLSAKLYL